MSQSPSDPPSYITVVCPVCGTRLDEVVKDESRPAKCPDCFTMVPVPARADIPVAPGPKPLPDIGTYRFETPAGTSKKSQQIAAQRKQQKERAAVLVICPLCAARIDTLARKEARGVKCPDCHELVRIPSRSEVEEKYRKRPKPRPRDEIEPLPLPTVEPQAKSVSMFYADAAAVIRRDEDSPLPRWTFFSAVYGLPWQAEVVSRWMYLTVGLAVMLSLTAFLVDTGMEAAGSQFGMVVAFFVLPLIWVVTWTLSYAAACCAAILQDTSAGNHRIVSWYDQNWKEWILVLTYLSFVGGVIIVTAHLTARLVEVGGGRYLPTLIGVAWIAFPIMLLSSLEADSVFVPLSAPIVRSLWRHFRGWTLFYGISTLTLLAPLVLLGLAVDAVPATILSLIVAPILAAVLFIYARLLGRLGWLISRAEERPRRSK